MQKHEHIPQDIRSLGYQSVVRPTLQCPFSLGPISHERYLTSGKWCREKRHALLLHIITEITVFTAMLEELKWPPLQECRFMSRISIMYKAINGQATVDIPAYVAKPARATHSQQHNRQMVNIRANKDRYKYSYFPWTVWCWNVLITQIVEATSVQNLHNQLWKAIQIEQIKINRDRPALR